jgi:putative salt-induced outer membrane protein YdiY
METSRLLKTVLITTALSAVPSLLLADVVETKNGAHLVGKVTQIDGSTVYLSTDYAGDLKIKQSDVTSITTDAPLNVRLASGTVLKGTLSNAANGGLQINGSDGTLSTSVSKVSATWAPDGVDPAIVALQRHWTYEVAVDIAGKSGNSSALGTQVSAQAELKTPSDDLKIYTGYNRQVSDGAKSADQFNAGVDYSNNFSGRYSWYVRDEAGFDRIKDISLYEIAGAGLGYDIIKAPKHTLTVRAGLSYQYDAYKDSEIPNVNSAGLDFGLEHEYDTKNWSLVNKLTDPSWKLRIGVSNDYTSVPVPGTKKLDTTYFTRLVLDWK